jgi:hypothetical protein
MANAPQLTTTGLFQVSWSYFYTAGNTCFAGNLNDGTANIAGGLMSLTKALQAELTQMSQDIAALKAEVASLKPKPTGLQSSAQAFLRR